MLDSSILDSGNRKSFSSGAVRDIDENKGRCDLIPLGELSECLTDLNSVYLDIIKHIDSFLWYGSSDDLKYCVRIFVNENFSDPYDAVLDLSLHYKDGCMKYGERNWERGIPLSSFIDSSVRHLTKWYRGDTDEPHDRAFIWNILGALYTFNHYKEYSEFMNIPAMNNDLSFGGIDGEEH